MSGKIYGIGSYIPVHYLDNNDLSKMVETNDTWIRERTGVIKRHVITDDTTVSMAAKAAKKALEDGHIKAEELDMIIVSTISSNVILPSTACEVQKLIGAVNATCFDLNAACTGFLLAYNTAQGFLISGMCKTILIIGAESLSKLIDWTDRGTCILFGDGAGAAVIREEQDALFHTIMHSDGSKGAALTCNSKHWQDTAFLEMDGQSVFKFAVRQVPICIQELLDKMEQKTEDIDYFILHQANSRIVDSVAKRLHAPIEKFPMNLEEYGNTSSASIPILLDEMYKEGKLVKGHKLILAGFGAGLTWGASYLEW
ncbi:MAG: beta-ketoacyl-ACP synthase III [Lachnospiraceae bacterium]